MTNRQKYKETFGFNPPEFGCLSNKECDKCPVEKTEDGWCPPTKRAKWWDSDYRKPEVEE